MPVFAILNPAPGNDLVNRKCHGSASPQNPNPQLFGLLFKEVDGNFLMDLGIQIPAQGGHDWSVEFTDPLACAGQNDCNLRVETFDNPVEADQILCNVPN